MLPIHSPGHSPRNTPPAVTPAATPAGGSPEAQSPATTPVHQILHAPIAPPNVRRQDRNSPAPLHPALVWAVPAHQDPAALVHPVVAHNLQNLMNPLLPGQPMPLFPLQAILNPAVPQVAAHQLAAPPADPLAGILGGLQPVNAPRPRLQPAAPAQRRNRNLMAEFEDARRAAENEGIAPQTPEVNEAQRRRTQPRP